MWVGQGVKGGGGVCVGACVCVQGGRCVGVSCCCQAAAASPGQAVRCLVKSEASQARQAGRPGCTVCCHYF